MRAIDVRPIPQSTIPALIDGAHAKLGAPGEKPSEVIRESGLVATAVRCLGPDPEQGNALSPMVVARLYPATDEMRRLFWSAGLVKSNASVEAVYLLDPGEDLDLALMEALHQAYVLCGRMLEAARQ